MLIVIMYYLMRAVCSCLSFLVQAVNPETKKSSMVNCFINIGCDTTTATKNLAKLLGLKQKSITEVNLATANAVL